MLEQPFLGQFTHTIDDKGRLTVPINYRELLNNRAYIMQGLDRNLMVCTITSFEKIYETVNKLSLTNPKARLFKRLILGSASLIEFDKLGRFLIPQMLREKYQLSDSAVIVGQGSYFEIWRQEYWNQQDAQIDEAKENPETFADLDLSFD